MLTRLFTALLILTGFASAEPYLIVRAAAAMEDGQSLGTFLGTWDLAIMNVQEDGGGKVLTHDELSAEFGSVYAAFAQASRNTVAMAETVSLDNRDQLARVVVQPMVAVSGLLTVDGALTAQREAAGLDEIRLALPTQGLLVMQKLVNAQVNVAFEGFAYQQSLHPVFGLDSQVIALDTDGYSITADPILTKEVTMTVSPDPENTLVITLKDGDVVIRMREDAAPNHVARMKELARAGFYDGILFHRVIEGFMAQTGDPDGRGTGGSGKNLNAEFSELPFERGTVGMARSQSPNSADSQFFIMFAEGSFLNGNYTVVGQVVEGMEFVDMIKRGEPPVDPDTMIKVQVQADM